MSVYYSVYAEANVDGKWYSLSPLFKTGKDDLKTHSIFWLQSLFYEVYNDLKDYALGYGIPDDMSVGLREVFRETRRVLRMADSRGIRSTYAEGEKAVPVLPLE